VGTGSGVPTGTEAPLMKRDGKRADLVDEWVDGIEVDLAVVA